MIVCSFLKLPHFEYTFVQSHLTWTSHFYFLWLPFKPISQNPVLIKYWHCQHERKLSRGKGCFEWGEELNLEILQVSGGRWRCGQKLCALQALPLSRQQEERPDKILWWHNKSAATYEDWLKTVFPGNAFVLLISVTLEKWVCKFTVSRN